MKTIKVRLPQYSFEDFAIGDRVILRASVFLPTEYGTITDVTENGQAFIVEWDNVDENGWLTYKKTFLGRTISTMTNKVSYPKQLLKVGDV